MNFELNLTHDQVDGLLGLLNDIVTVYTSDAGVLLAVEGEHAQLARELAEERLKDIALAQELIAWLGDL